VPTPSRLDIGRITRRIEKISELRRADVDDVSFVTSLFFQFLGQQEPGKALERGFGAV
jgi:hypothetical protein